MSFRITESVNQGYTGKVIVNVTKVYLSGLGSGHFPFPYNVLTMFLVGKLGFVPSVGEPGWTGRAVGAHRRQDRLLVI
jgi:hypothetical protein